MCAYKCEDMGQDPKEKCFLLNGLQPKIRNQSEIEIKYRQVCQWGPFWRAGFWNDTRASSHCQTAQRPWPHMPGTAQKAASRRQRLPGFPKEPASGLEMPGTHLSFASLTCLNLILCGWVPGPDSRTQEDEGSCSWPEWIDNNGLAFSDLLSLG